MSFISDYKRRKARGEKMRPLWQIALLLPIYPIYAGMRWIVETVEGR